MALTITPLDAPLGAEVTGLDIVSGVADADFEKILDAFYRYQVLVFRAQKTMTPAAQVAFSQRFGALEPQVGDDLTVEGFPEILVLSNDLKDGEVIGKVDGGDYWHSDSSHRELPAMATILFSIKNSKEGGDTEFANMYAAYDALSEDKKNLISDLRGVHDSNKLVNKRVTVSADRPGAAEYYAMRAKVKPSVVHPLVRTHPITGRKSLYASPRFTIAIENMDDAEADPLLDELFAHQIKPDFVYRHKWQEDDLIIWDNRCLNHHATGGYRYPDVRIMHRTVIAGDAPF